MIKTFLISQLYNDLRKYDNIQKIAVGQEDYYSTGCLLDHSYFNNYFKMIEIDLSKQQALEADPRTIQQINFTRNLEKNATIFFTILDFSQGTVKVLWIYFTSI